MSTLSPNSPDWSSYVSLQNLLGKFDKRSNHFLFGENCITSHNRFSSQCIVVVRGKLTSISIRTKRFNGGKGEKTIFSSDFSPFERLGVDHCCFKSILCWSHCLVSLAHTKCSCRVKKKISVKFYGGAVTISDNNFLGDFSGISLTEKVGPPF